MDGTGPGDGAANDGAPLRVLRLLTRPNLGGPTRQAIALWHAQRALGVRTLLVTGVVDAGEAVLSPADGGIPRCTAAEVEAAGEGAQGWLELPSLRRRIAPLGDRRALRQLRVLLRRFRPHVVHTHTSKAGWLGRRAAFAERVPVVAHTFHGHVLQDYFARPTAWALQRLERRLAARTTLLFAVSASCADELAAAGIAPRARFRVVPPAVALVPVLARAEARRALGLAGDDRAVVCVGRLVPIKRVEHFVRAVAALPGCRGEVFGDGPERPALAALASALAPGRIVFRGARADVAALLPAFDALVLPSVREGWPLVAVEAAAAGVPVVGYDVPGVRDALLVLPGRLVPAAAGPAGLASALAGVLAASPAPAAPATLAPFAPGAVAAALVAAYRDPTIAARRYHAGPRA